MKKGKIVIKKPAFILGIAFIVLGCSLGATSLAWLIKPQSNAVLGETKGKGSGSYFESGNGSKDSPYVIVNAKQLYYFNWLQDLGYFNKDANGNKVVKGETNKIETVYFTLGADFDASGYVLPPAGTSTYPFVGHFEGGEHVISNLTISNSWEELGTGNGSTKQYPSGAEQDGDILKGAEIVGFFGIVGEYASSASGVTTSESKDDSGAIVTTSTNSGSLVYDVKSVSGETTTYINSVNNLYFENLTVKSDADQVLAGFIAGYANGQIDNCGVQSGQFSFKNGVSNLSDGTLKESNLSKYALIGDCTKNLNWTGQPGVDGGATGNDWGSSIDMQEITRRVNYINALASKPYDAVYESSEYACYNRAMGGKEEKHWKGSGVYSQNYHLYSGTYLPLSIDTTTAWPTDDETEGTNSGWHTTQYYIDHKDSGGEYSIISNNNSGYLVGGGRLDGGSLYKDTENGYGYVTLRFSKVSLTISGSTSSDTYDSSATVYSVDTRNGTTNTEITESNYENFGYSKYPTVKGDFDSIHAKINTHMYGFHFYPMNEQASGFKSDMVKAKLFGTEYASYQFLKGALNFTTKTDGVVTTMLASYYSNKDAMFDLFSITRDSDHKITDISRIKKIYKDSNGQIIYDPSDTSGLTKVFDFDNVTYSSEHTSNYFQKSKALYYFEIPLKAGDYAIGKSKTTVDGVDSSKSTGACAYILYLDIGANAGDGKQETTDPVPTNIDFVYKDNGSIVKITDENYAPSGVTFALSGSTSSSGLLYFKRNTSTGGVFFYVESGYSVVVAGTGTNTGKTSKKDYDDATA